MTSKERNRRSKAAMTLTKAHSLWNLGMKHAITWRKLIGLCWELEKGGIEEKTCYVKGVSFSNDDGTSRQLLLQRLSKVTKGIFWITLTREKDNSYDPNAIKVEAIKEGGGKATLGYIPRALAEIVAPLIDSGKEAVVTGFEFTNPLCGLIGMKVTLICK